MFPSVYTHVFTSNIVNEAHYSWFRENLQRLPPLSATTTDFGAKYGLPAAVVGYGFPRLGNFNSNGVSYTIQPGGKRLFAAGRSKLHLCGQSQHCAWSAQHAGRRRCSLDSVEPVRSGRMSLAAHTRLPSANSAAPQRTGGACGGQRFGLRYVSAGRLRLQQLHRSRSQAITVTNTGPHTFKTTGA